MMKLDIHIAKAGKVIATQTVTSRKSLELDQQIVEVLGRLRKAHPRQSLLAGDVSISIDPAQKPSSGASPSS